MPSEFARRAFRLQQRDIESAPATLAVNHVLENEIKGHWVVVPHHWT
jgi:hypothetical protein